MRHVLDQIQDPYEFLLKLKKCSLEECSIYIEAPNLDYSLKNGFFFDITNERCNFFNINTLAGLFDNVIDQGFCFDNQYIYIYADLNKLITPTKIINQSIDEYDWNYLYKSLDNCHNKLKKYKFYIWGAGGKGVMFNVLFEHYFKDIKDNIMGLIDINPLKQNKYVPITGKKVFDYDQIPNDPLYIAVMNQNYISEIKKILKPNHSLINISDYCRYPL